MVKVLFLKIKIVQINKLDQSFRHILCIHSDDGEISGIILCGEGAESIKVPLIGFNDENALKMTVSIWDTTMTGAIDQV